MYSTVNYKFSVIREGVIDSLNCIDREGIIRTDNGDFLFLFHPDFYDTLKEFCGRRVKIEVGQRSMKILSIQEVLEWPGYF